MATINEMFNRVGDFLKDFSSNIEQAVVVVDSEILDLERDQLRNSQSNSNDEPITPEYSTNAGVRKKYKKFYDSKKGIKNPNLFDTGSFQNKLILNVNYPKFEIHSKDYKDPLLREKYGDLIHGIAPSRQNKAYSITTPAIARLMKSKGIGK